MNLKRIDRTIRLIEKEKYKKIHLEDAFLSHLMDLMDKIEEYGSYWKRERLSISNKYDREEIILNYIKNLLLKCGLNWQQDDPITDIKETREKYIKKQIKKYLDDLGL